jgi:mRNA interferase HigB
VPILGTWYYVFVRIIARSSLVRFTANLSGNKDHKAVKSALDSWYQEVRYAEWKNSSDVKASYAHASIVGSDRVVFNIKGNSYRLVTATDFRRGTVFIKWLGSHKDYDAIDVRTVQYASETDQD